MLVWWGTLTLIEQIFACIAIPATVILVLQTILLIFSSFGGDGADAHDAGTDHDTGTDHDAGTDHGHGHGHHHGHAHHARDAGLRIFSVRGFVTFFCMFGWTGLVLMRNGATQAVSITAGIVVGFIFMVLIAVAFVWFLKLQQNGAMDIKHAVGVSGSAYLGIPAKRAGKGKVSAIISGRYSVLDAVTDEKIAIPTHSAVTVVGVTGDNVLVVVKK